jgi:hypothetical protein
MQKLFLTEDRNTEVFRMHSLKFNVSWRFIAGLLMSASKLLKSGDGSLYPSTQRQYRRLIYYDNTLLHVSVVRPLSGKNILIATVSQLSTDPLFTILLTLY